MLEQVETLDDMRYELTVVSKKFLDTQEKIKVMADELRTQYREVNEQANT